MKKRDIPRGDLAHELRHLYGDQLRLYAGTHHARFIPPDMPIHVISRVFQGRFLLVPHKMLNSIIAGVIGRAQSRYRGVKLFAIAVLCNHMHLMLMGPPQEVVGFIRYVKSSISYRWSRCPWVRWSGTMWHEYISTALPTPESEEVCLKYILSHGVKEKLVTRPQQWPGVHAARHLLTGEPLEGEWFDSTGWTRARDAEKRKKHGRAVRKNAYYTKYRVQFSGLPAWERLTEEERRGRIRQMVSEIESEGRLARQGTKALGARAVLRLGRQLRTALPKLPWFEARRKLIAWAAPRDPRTVELVRRHWSFQRAFRWASEAFRKGELTVEFPAGAFRPVTFQLGLESG